MSLRRALLAVAVAALVSSVAFGLQRNRQEPPAQAPAAAEPGARPAASPSPSPEAKKEQPETPPVVTHHELHAGGKTLHYTATAGMMPMKNSESGEVEAHMFYIWPTRSMGNRRNTAR